MISRRLLFAVILLSLLIGGLAASPAHAQEGGISCTTTVAQSLIDTGQDIFYSAQPRSTNSGDALFFWSTGDLDSFPGGIDNSDGNIELFRSELVFEENGSVTRSFRQVTDSIGNILGGFNLAPEVSGDGKYLIFFSDRSYPRNDTDLIGGRNFKIWLADLTDLDNIKIRQITTSTVSANLYPTIANDGKRVAYVSDNDIPDGNLDIYLIDISSPSSIANPTLVGRPTPLGILNEGPKLSGDGSTLVFTSNRTFQDAASGVTVNADGNVEIFAYDVQTRNLKAVTNTTGNVVNETAAVSADGQWITFVRGPGSGANDPARQVYLASNPNRVGAGFIERISVSGTDNFNPSISSGGDRILYQQKNRTPGDTASQVVIQYDGIQNVILYDRIAQDRQIFRSRTNPNAGELGTPALSGNGTVLFYEDEGGISTVECTISDLSLTASVTPGRVIAGESQTFVWAVANAADSVASGVTVTGTLPSGFVPTSLLPAESCSLTGQSISCLFPRLEAMGTRTMTATVAVANDLLGDQTVAFRAFSNKSTDRDPSNNDRVLASQVVAQADLGILKTAFPDTALLSEDITYTLVISNVGPSLSRSVRVTDTLPFGLDFQFSDGCDVVAGETGSQGPVVSCFLGDMQPGPESTITRTIRTTIGTNLEGFIENEAEVASGLTFDPPGGLSNSVAITNSVNTDFDLAVSQSAAPPLLLAGGRITYTTVVTNYGLSTAEAVVLTGTLPGELTLVGTPSGAQGCTGGLTFACTLGQMELGDVIQVTIVGVISPTHTGTLTSSVGVFSVNQVDADRRKDNNFFQLPNGNQPIIVAQQADLKAELISAPSDVLAGEDYTYILSIENLGPSAAEGVVLADTPPAGWSLLSIANSVSSCSGSTFAICEVPLLLPNESVIFTVTLALNQNAALGSQPYAVAVQSLSTDPNPANDNVDFAVTVADEASLTINKLASATSVVAGQTESLVYTLYVYNDGPSLARSVVLTDTLPDGVQWISPAINADCTEIVPGTLSCTVDDIDARDSNSAQISVRVLPGAAGTLTNTATVSTSASDPTGINTDSVTTSVTQQADLTVTKQVNGTSLNVGATAIYTVGVANAGPSNATNVVIADTLPSGLYNATFTPVDQNGQPAGSYDQGLGLWTVGDLDAGQRVTMTITALISSTTSSTTVVNTARVDQVDQPDPGPGLNSSSASFTVPANADVAVAQSVSDSTPNVGRQVTLVLTATNNGPETATNVVISDLLPVELRFVGSLAGAGSYSQTTGLWQVGSLGIASSTRLTITAQVIDSGSFTNTATITADQYDDKATNNRADVVLNVDQAADLRLAQVASTSTPNVEGTLYITLTLTNDGPDTATNVAVRDALPTLLTGATVQPGASTTYSTTTNLWTIPSIAKGQSFTLVVIKTLKESGPILNTAEVSASSLFDPDSIPNNGVGNGEDDQVSLSLTVPAAADLAVFKSITPAGGADVGDTIFLNYRVENNGPDTATGIVVTDTLASQLTQTTVILISAGGSYNVSTGRWDVPDLDPGQNATLDLTVLVGSGGAGQTIVDNTDALYADQYDPVPNNNIGQTSIAIAGADLRLSKSVSNPNPNVGDPVVYTITVTNDGPTDTTNVRVTDILPAGFSSPITYTSQGNFGPAAPTVAGVWEVGSLAETESATLVITGVVASGYAGQTITNTIQGATSDVVDGNQSNNKPSAAFVVQSADLVVTKLATNLNPAEGEEFSYRLAVENKGPDNATNVVITDLLPSNIEFRVSIDPNYNPTTGAWTVGTIAAKTTSPPLFIVVRPKVTAPGVPGAGGRTITNTVTGVRADQEDSNTANTLINASAVITVVGADLALSKIVNTTTPNVGERVFFTATLTNNGPYATGQIVVTDTLPTGLTLSGSPTVTGTFDSGSVLAISSNSKIITWTIPAMPIGASLQLRLAALTDAGTGGLSLANTVAVVSAKRTNGLTMPDPVSQNNAASRAVIPQAADLQVTMADRPDPLVAGTALIYTTTVTNLGPTAAANFILTDTLPTGSTFLSATPGCTLPSSLTVVCTQTSSLAVGVGAAKQYTVAITYTKAETITNTAKVTSTTSEPTGTLANNTGSESTQVRNSPASKFVMSITGGTVPLSTTVYTAGVPFNVRITAQDAYSNIALDYTGLVTLTSNSYVGSINATITSGGFVDSVTQTPTIVGNGDRNIGVTDGLISTSNASGNFTVNPGPLDHFVFNTVTSPKIAGTGFPVTVTAQDAYNNTATQFVGTVGLSTNGGLITPTVSAAFTAGQLTQSMTVTLAGTGRVITAISGLATGASNGFTVNAGAATQLVITTQPVGPDSTKILSTQPVVELRDVYGNVLTTNNSSTVTAAILNAPNGVNLFGNNNPVTVQQGVAAFTNLEIKKSGTYQLRFSTNAGGFVVDSQPFTINAGPATTLVFSTQPVGATAGNLLATQPVVRTEDNNGNASIVGLPAIITVTLSLSGAGPLQGTAVLTTATGIASFTNLQVDVAGSKQLNATADAEGVALAPALSTSFVITPAALDHFVFTTVTGSKTAGTPFNVTMTAQDIFNNTATQFVGTVGLTTNGGLITPTVSSAFVAGQRTQSVTLTQAGSSRVITATSGLATGASNGFTVIPGAAAQLAITTQPVGPDSTKILDVQPVVELQDVYGNVLDTNNSATVTAAILNPPSGANLFGTRTVGVIQGVATFTNLEIKKSGTYQLRFSTNAGGFVVDSQSFSINAGPATTLVYTTQPVGTTAGNPLATQPVVRTEDSNGNPSSVGLPSTITITLALSGTGPLQGTTVLATSSGTASFTGLQVDVAGSKRLTATADAGIVLLAPALSNSFTITPAALDHFVFNPVSDPQTAGTPFPVTVTAQDAFNNTATQFVGTVGLTTNGGLITPTVTSAFVAGQVTQPVTLTLAGAGRVITATSGLITGASNSFTVDPGALAKFVLGPVSSPKTAGVSFTLSMTATDALNNRLTGFNGTANLTTNGGLITPTTSSTFVSGLLTQPVTVTLAGAGRVITATSVGAVGASNGFSVVAGPAAKLVITQQPSAVDANTAIVPPVLVQVSDLYGNPRITDNSSTVTVTLASGTGAITGSSTKSATVAAGVASFNNIKLNQTGAKTLHFDTSAGNFGVDSDSFTVNPGTATQLVFITQPGNATAGSPFGNQPVVQTQDASGNPSTVGVAPGALVTITLAAGTGPLQGTATAAISGGLATFINLRIDTSGANKQLAATTPGLTSATSNVFTVMAAALDHFTFSTVSSPKTAGASFPVTMTAVDAFGNGVTGFVGTVDLTTNGGLITPTVSSAFVAGQLTQPITVTQAGASRFITATQTGGSASGSSGNFTVNPGAATQLTVETQPSGAVAGSAFSSQPVVALRDVYGNLRTTENSATVTATIQVGPAGAAFHPSSALSAIAANGVATFADLRIDYAASNYVLRFATSAGVFTTTSASFPVSADAFTRLLLLMPGQSATPGLSPGKTGSFTLPVNGVPFTVTVNGTDAYFNTIITAADEISITTSDINAVLPSSASLVAGTQKFSLTLSSGTRVITATDLTNAGIISDTSPSLAIASGLVAVTTDAAVQAGQQAYAMQSGGTAQVSILATNSGPAEFVNGRLRWVAPAGLQVMGAQVDGRSCVAEGTNWLCDFGNLPAGSQLPASLDISADAVGEYLLEVVLEGDRLDLNPDNDRVAISVIVSTAEQQRNLFLPLLQNRVDEERDKSSTEEIYLPGVTRP